MVTGADLPGMQVSGLLHLSADGRLSTGCKPTEPTSFCKRCMSKWGEDGRGALCTFKMGGDSRRMVREVG